MPKHDSTTGEAIVSESGNWNVASDFARIKIMLPLAKCEHYEDITRFGYESIAEELMGYQVPNDYVRYTGLTRLINELLKICKNSMFAMKKGNTKKDLEDYEKELKRIKGILNLLVVVKRNNINKTKELVIIPDKFNDVFEIVLQIKSSINIPLNQNHLIFTDKEEFDPHAYKKSMKERMTSRG